MKEKWMLIVVMIIIIFTQGAKGSTYILSPEKAVDIFISENRSMKISRLELDNAKVDFRKAEAENLAVQSKSAALRNELALASSEQRYFQTYNSEIVDLIEQYFTLLITKTEIDIKANAVILEEMKLDRVKAQAEIGQAGELELMAQQNEYTNVLIDLESTKDDYMIELNHFLSRLNLDEEDVKLEVVTPPVDLELDKGTVLERAVEESTELEIRRIEIELARIELERNKAISAPQLDMESVKNNLKLRELEKEEALDNLRRTIDRLYSMKRNAHDRLTMAEGSLRQTTKNFENVRAQKDAGLVDEGDLLSARISLMEAEVMVEEVRLNYYLSYLELMQHMAYDLGVVISETMQ